MKATAIAPSNIAFIKYWGKKDEKLRLPENGSISMNLSNMTSTTTVKFFKKYSHDTFMLDGVESSHAEVERVTAHLNRIRKKSGISYKARVVSKNSFSVGTGLSSSASGLAALTIAASRALSLDMSEKELSILARLGSGSACRSIPDGFVEWVPGMSSETSFAQSIYPYDYWDIVDIVAMVSTEKKKISSSDGQKRVGSSPFYSTRQKRIKQKIEECKQALKERDFTKLGLLAESEALEMHAVMLTSTPSLVYWTPESLRLMKQIISWRSKRVECYFTLNTGQDVHILCRRADADVVVRKLDELSYVNKAIINSPSEGAREISQHLF